MFYLRNRRLARAVACFFLLEIIGGIVAPAVTWAAMGPSQPEFTSYEAPGGTDMVNLVTGDLAYSIPLLDIPGPERSFSMPLTYKAGIQLEQEASWVGLGWSLNPGAIARSVNGYPDDASDEPVKLTMDKWVGSSRDFSDITGLLHVGWSSATGWSGSVDLIGLASLNWDKNGIGGDLLGIGYKDGEFSVDPVRMAMAAVTIATLGVGSAATLGARVGINVAISLGTSAVANTAFGLGRRGSVGGFLNKPSTLVSGTPPFYKYERTQYNNDFSEFANGSLYFGRMSRNVNSAPVVAPGNPSFMRWPNWPNVFNAPQITNPLDGTSARPPRFNSSRQCDENGNTLYETAADIYQPVQGSEDYYSSSKRPISIAHDYFNVMGGDASGTIRPNRLDVGSVAYPKMGLDDCAWYGKYMAIPFLDEEHDHYKVGFRYEGGMSNAYEYQAYTPTGGAQTVGFDVNASNNGLLATDPRLSNPAARVEPLRTGITNGLGGGASNRQLVQGKHTVWYSNKEIEAMATYTNGVFNGYANGFSNFATPQSDRIQTGTAPDGFRHALPPNGIGAFSVTTEDGSTYHYSLPVYHRTTYSESNEQQLSTTIEGSDLAKSTRTEGRPNTTNPHGGYATTWLLTAITSADYVDRNNSGTVDAADWGGWVRFDYGKFSSAFKWRAPYVGTSFTDTKSPIEFESFAEGVKETYYLNSISTRTHTALFIKSMRQDGRGHFNAGSTWNAQLGINDQFPAASLRLDEIVLFDNATLTKLQTPDGVRAPNDPNPTPIPALSAANDAAATNCGAGDSWGQVLDAGDFATDASGRLRAYFEANLIKRIRFNYGYDLCRGTPNSFTCQYGQVNSLPPMGSVAQAQQQRGGKLTLKSVSFFGPTVDQTVTKIIPDFTFSYDNPAVNIAVTNPMYGKEKWDAFGMYQPTGAHTVESHRPDQAPTYAAPWTLTKITTPLGGTTEIAYERDEYAHVSEFGTKSFSFRGDGSEVLTLQRFGTNSYTADLQDVIRPGDYLELSGIITFTCKSQGYNGQVHHTIEKRNIRNQRVKVLVVDNNTVTLENGFEASCAQDELLTNGPSVNVSATLANDVLGGDVRVASITTTNPESGAHYQVRYQYTNDRPQRGNSSGVLAKEPGFINKIGHSFETQFDYPSTPVLYGQVSVLRGPFQANNDADWRAKEVYTFFTPSSSMIVEQRPAGAQYPGFNGPQVEFYTNNVEVRTGMIGRPKAVHTYNQRGQRELATEFEYAEQLPNADNQAHQGQYTEGVMTNELLANRFFNTNRTTKRYYPAVMVASHSTRNGVSIDNASKLFDFFTGQALETTFRNSRNETYHARTIPAYVRYPTMGPKGLNGANSNMLLQAAAQYNLKEKTTGPAYDPLNFLQTAALLSASVQTWQSTWDNYRGATVAGDYADLPGPYKPVWRQQAAYQWQSPLLNPDGSFAGFSDYTGQGTPDAHWIKTGETVRYDHYSHALESRGVNGEYSTIRTGYGETLEIASAANAKYTEIAYSGAEDVPTLINGLKHFGGEVATDGAPVSESNTVPQPHTGKYSVQLGPSKTLRYRALVGSEVAANKPYRLSAWIHASDLAAGQGRLYAAVNGVSLGETSITAPETKKAGAWYRLMLTVKIPAGMIGQAVEFGCRNAAGTATTTPVYVDDFRVSPLVAPMTSQVYAPRTNQAIYVLDNENLYTRYLYNSVGRLLRVYKETFDRPNEIAVTPRLVKEYGYNYGQLYVPTWISDGYRCVADGNGNSTGALLEERHVIDVNPLNNTPVTARWELNGQSLNCITPTCSSDIDYNTGEVLVLRRLRNNYCEEAYRISQHCEPAIVNNRPGNYISYTWQYPNGDTEDTPGRFQESNCPVFRAAKRPAKRANRPTVESLNTRKKTVNSVRNIQNEKK